jgi:cell division protein FtsL
MPRTSWKRERTRRRIPARAFFWLVTPLLVMLVVWQQASVERMVVSLERARAERTKLESQVDALRLEADRLSSLGQVESRAEHELGMVRPGTEQIVDLVFPGQNEQSPGFPWVREAIAGTREDTGTREDPGTP